MLPCTGPVERISLKSTGTSWIDDDFTGRTAEQNVQSIQDVTAQDAFLADKVHLQPAWIISSIKLSPDLK
jgi:hypothetical protein